MNEDFNTEEDGGDEGHQITVKSFFGHPVIQGTVAMGVGALIGKFVVDSPSAQEVGAAVGVGTLVAAHLVKDRWSAIMANPKIQTLTSGIARLG